MPDIVLGVRDTTTCKTEKYELLSWHLIGESLGKLYRAAVNLGIDFKGAHTYLRI